MHLDLKVHVQTSLTLVLWKYRDRETVIMSILFMFHHRVDCSDVDVDSQCGKELLQLGSKVRYLPHTTQRKCHGDNVHNSHCYCGGSYPPYISWYMFRFFIASSEIM